jgi:hypothetical protein
MKMSSSTGAGATASRKAAIESDRVKVCLITGLPVYPDGNRAILSEESKMKSRGAKFWIFLVILGLGLIASSCSSPHPVVNGNSSAPSGLPDPQASTNTQGPLFEVTAAWKPKKVTVETYAIGGSPPNRYTLTPKAGAAFVAVELILKQDDSSKPVPAALWSGTVLVDSSGGRHQLMFSYPSTIVKYAPNGDSVEYNGDAQIKAGDLASKKLSEMGGKLVVVFEAPPKDTEFKLEITNSAPLQVSLKA